MLAANASAPDLQHLHHTTQGNPLFVVETVRAGLDNASQARLPAKVRAVILARFSHSRCLLTSLQALLLR